MEEEVASQPGRVGRRGRAGGRSADVLPPPGARVCVVGCGTSLFVAQAYAALREARRPRLDRRVRRVRAAHRAPLRRAGRDLALGHDDRGACTRSASDVADRTLAITADGGRPGGRARRRRDRAPVRRRAVGRADPLRHRRAHAAARAGRSPARPPPRPPPRARARGAAAGRDPAASSSGRSSAAAGPSASPSEAALKLRECAAGVDRGLPAVRVPPRADQHRRAGARDLAARRRSTPRSPTSCARTGATVVARRARPARRPRARRSAPRSRSRGPRARPGPPAQPDALGRPRRPRPGAAADEDTLAHRDRRARRRGAVAVLRRAPAAAAASSRRRGAAGEPVTITFWHGQNQTAGKTINELVDKFNATHPKIKVDAPDRRASPTGCWRR